MFDPPESPRPPPVEQRTAPPSETAYEWVALLERLLNEEGRRESALEFFLQLHPTDRAEALTGLRGGLRRRIAAELSPETAAGLLEYLEPRIAASAFRDYPAPRLAAALDLAAPPTAAAVLDRLPDERRRRIISEMAARRPVETLLQYPDGAAGRLASPAAPVFHERTTAPNALDQLRLMGAAAESVSALPVVNDAGVLVGSLNPVRLALARPGAAVGDLMERNLTSVTASADEEVAAQLIGQFKVSQLPVVESDGRLVGLIRAGDAVEVVQEQATEDMFRIAGMGEERAAGPLGDSVRSRLPWLVLNLATVFLAALVIGYFDSTIAQVVALAAFLPVVAGQGGIAGTQTVTLVVRSLATGELPRQRGLRLLRQELALGLLHGLVIGAIAGAVGWLWQGNPILGGVVALAMAGNMLAAALAGAGIPLLLRRLGLDPAVSAVVFVTTFTDIAGFALLLGLAALLIRHLT